MGKSWSKSSTPPPPTPDFDPPWRKVEWTHKELLINQLKSIQLNHPELQNLRILLHGPVGAGKSCFINSVMSAFHGEVVTMAREQANAKKSCTKTYKAYQITTKDNENLPFIFNDVMGLEATEEDGMHPDDVVNALLGHIREDYQFNPTCPISEKDPSFIREPSLQDKVHCLVSVVSASSISRMEKDVINKMGIAREKANTLDIPHVVIMTKVDDDVCPLVKKDLQKIYMSKKIKDKMQACSNDLGPPMKLIFPVSNYYEENETNDTKDVLILLALVEIAKIARRCVRH
ncbi:interferon-induced protein 44-like [Astyanax mexicanus]|nr:interferon-induced protein 44-like [Astyanax mexicanus]